jgi:hypothetical protein
MSYFFIVPPPIWQQGSRLRGIVARSKHAARPDIKGRPDGFERIREGIDATIEPGNVAELVSVVGDAPLIDTTSASSSRSVNQNEVLNLPLVNRDLYSLLNTTGGVTSNDNSNSLGQYSSSPAIRVSAGRKRITGTRQSCRRRSSGRASRCGQNSGRSMPFILRRLSWGRYGRRAARDGNP